MLGGLLSEQLGQGVSNVERETDVICRWGSNKWQRTRMKAGSGQVVSCCVYDKTKKLCSTCMATFHTCLTLGRSVSSSPSTKELHDKGILSMLVGIRTQEDIRVTVNSSVGQPFQS